MAALVPRVLRAGRWPRSTAGIGFTIDAEEAERLELSLDIIEALAADDPLLATAGRASAWRVQAYQKRARAVGRLGRSRSRGGTTGG